jgi:2-dehydropantoate 2-reductase
MTYLGEFDPPPASVTARIHDLVGRLVAAGIPSAGVPDIRSVLWSKACNAVGIFGVSVLTRLAGSQMWANPDLVRAFRALVRETDLVAKASGVTVGDYRGFPIRTYLQMTASEHVEYAAELAAGAPAGPVAPGAFPSMTQDLMAGRTMEVEEVFGDVVARADRLGVDVPRITLVSDLLRGLNAAITG